MLKFRRGYFIIAIALFVAEICIAKFFHDGFIRNNLGDFLVVILIYCTIRSFLKLSVLSTSVFVLLFSYGIEILQYFKIVEKLGLQNYKIARIVIGTSFGWSDMLAYTLGIGLVLLIEKLRVKKW
jgi:hypothetical protein